MKKAILLVYLLTVSTMILAQNNYPVVGISDERPEKYGLKNATVVVDYEETLPNTDILIVKGRIAAVGSNLTFPKGTVVKDIEGKMVYPSFIDLFTSYGLPESPGETPNSMAMFMVSLVLIVIGAGIEVMI